MAASIHYLIKHSFVSILLALLNTTWAVEWSLENKQKFNDYVKAVMDCRQIPGLQVSVVQNGRVILTEGYGLRNSETRAPVSATTKFPIGSLTKAFTANILAMQLSQKPNLGKYNWDTPIVKIFGDTFQLMDDMRTQNVNIRDLLSHRVGVPSYFTALLTGFPSTISRKELVWKLRYMRSVPDSFRSKLIYNNYMYVLAGYISEHLANGTSWESLVRNMIFQPLEMTSSTFVDVLDDVEDFAFAHTTLDGVFELIDNDVARAVHPAGPAGSIVSNALDISTWMLYQLKHGQDKEGVPLVSREFFDETWKGQMPEPFSERNIIQPEFPVEDINVAYDFGWITSVYRGYRKIWHSGGISTYSSLLNLFPDKNAGVYGVVNGGGPHKSVGLKMILNYASDLLLNQEPWLNQSTACTFPQPWEPPVPGNTSPVTTPTYRLDLELDNEYNGNYSHPMFGDISVHSTLHQGAVQLKLNFGRFGVFSLSRSADLSNSFKATFSGILSYLSTSDLKVPPLMLIFKDKNKAGKMTRLEFPVDQMIKTDFIRDFKLNDIMGNSNAITCPCCTNRASKNAYNGRYFVHMAIIFISIHVLALG
ncbi:unnamed protein product [Owenia fusiformis]|uniref:Uncharacterized protein n=1 Tax=Owenia fusiformis TaxID=6347 RepID=A0A8J1THZ3_OWEFU|nr:unnamed protein product [Owenia fusiformis]